VIITDSGLLLNTGRLTRAMEKVIDNRAPKAALKIAEIEEVYDEVY
jgi:hypothetical protein